MKNLNELLHLAAKFETLTKRAQTVSVDTSLVDSIKKMYGQQITNIAGQMLGSRAVSSIPIAVNWNKPAATFEVDAIGSDADKVNQDLKNALDQKFGPGLSRIIASKAPNTPSFRFNLFTVE